MSELVGEAPNSCDAFGITRAIFVIESPGSDDLPEVADEGIALSDQLVAHDVPHKVIRVGTVRGLVLALRMCAASVKRRIRDRPVAATIHLCAHGNEDGFWLTDSKFVSWSLFRAMLLEFARATGRINRHGVALQGLNLSSCRGFHASRMFDWGAPNPCIGIIGSRENIWSDDALRGYLALYKAGLERNLALPESLSLMNAAVGRELFDVVNVPGVDQLISAAGKQRATAYARVRAQQSRNDDSATQYKQPPEIQ